MQGNLTRLCYTYGMGDLVLEHLKRIQARLDSMEREIIGLKSAVIASREIMASFLKNDAQR